MLTTILMVFAFVFFILAGLGIPNPPRLNFIGWGLAFWVAAILFGGKLIPGL